jgi:hypothetical protein
MAGAGSVVLPLRALTLTVVLLGVREPVNDRQSQQLSDNLSLENDSLVPSNRHLTDTKRQMDPFHAGRRQATNLRNAYETRNVSRDGFVSGRERSPFGRGPAGLQMTDRHVSFKEAPYECSNRAGSQKKPT